MSIDMTSPKPFRIGVSDDVLERIRARVAGYVWHEMPDDGGWAYGANLDYMKELCAYWLDEFDWRAQEEMLNRFAHFTAPVDGIDIHFIHERGQRSGAPAAAHLPRVARLSLGVRRDHRSARPSRTPWRQRERCIRRDRPFLAGIRLLGPSGTADGTT